MPDPELDDAPESGAFGDLLRDVAAAPRLPPELMRTVTFDAAHGVVPKSPALGRGLPALGDVVDARYRIDRELGRGGMGVVFRAHNLRTGRDVALKWMLPRGLSRSASERSESVERFVREARAVSRIDHPNVVRVLDVGGDPEMPYLVMECLSGESLRAKLERGPLSWEEALLLVAPVMQGVTAAHRAGVVHRDLKPDNIFLCSEVVKVLDFGVSRIGDGEDQTTLTRTGTMLGTPAYMPLEQLRGSRDIDARTDVYALGVILFEALSGRLPFEAQTPADQAVLLATREPEALSELCPSLKGARADAVMKALARKPSDRYASVEEFQQALFRAALGRRGPVTSLTVLVLAILCGMLAWWLWPTPRPEMAPQRKVAEKVEAKLPEPAERVQETPLPVPPIAPAPAATAPSVQSNAKPVRPSVKATKAAVPESPSLAPIALSAEQFQAVDSAKVEEAPPPPEPSAKSPAPGLDPTEF